MGDVTKLIGRVKHQSKQAFSLLVGRYLRPLTTYAERKLNGPCAAFTGGEDVALSACYGLWRAVEKGDHLVNSLTDRHSFRRALQLLAWQRIRRARRDATRQKRDFQRVTTLKDDARLDNLPAAGISPQDEVLENLTVQELLRVLSEKQRVIVQLKQFHSTNEEIARHLGWSLRTVERQWSAIRTLLRERYPELTERAPAG